jgi:NAD(P)H-hydrate epimerase
MYIATSSQIRKADQLMIEEYQFPGLLLMETAGRKCAEFILEQYPNQSHCFILAGPGNNGGDGFVIARYLHQAGKNVEILLSHPPDKYQGDALINYNALQGADLPIVIWGQATPQLTEGTLIIDALLGTGIKDAPRGPIADIIREYSDLGLPSVAIDLPSGLNADTGLVYKGFQPISATYTLTFQCPKICHFVTPASNFCGKVVTVEIGIWPEVMEELEITRFVLDGNLASSFWQSPPKDTHKGRQGHSLLLGGTRQFAGAIALSSHAVLRSGGGLSTAVTVEAARMAIYAVGPEVMVKAFPGDSLSEAKAEEVVDFVKNLRPDALGIGPGMGKEAANLMSALLKQFAETPMVLDADALNLLADHPQMWDLIPENAILTPHPGEFARLAGEEYSDADRINAAEKFAREKNVILVLKGAQTVIASPDGQTFVNASGNPGMATAGSGDVLTGTITSLLSRGYAPFFAAALGVYLHGLAGDLCAEESGEAGVTAGGIMNHLGKAIEMVQTESAPQILSI